MNEHEGLRQMAAEMERQRQDALTTLDTAGEPASKIAAAIADIGKLVLYGMGGSHHVNRIVEPLYRQLGIECHAVPCSGALIAPQPAGRRVAIFASQSGESGEVAELLKTDPGLERRFGLTLDGDSTLARIAETCIVAHGGPELAFAATRSIILTLAMHAAVLEALGAPQHGLRVVLETEPSIDIGAMSAALSGCDTIVFAGHHVMQGVAESAALSLMELSRVSAIGFEIGQFRHGPFEFLRPGIGVVLLRSASADKDMVLSVARSASSTGAETVVLDASGMDEASEGICLVALPKQEGLAAAAQSLLLLQDFNISVARQRGERAIGTPRHTTKITR